MSDTFSPARTYGPVETFSSCCKKNHFNHAGLFSFADGFFVIVKAYGLDAETIVRSQSSKDFWDGTITTFGKWNSFQCNTDGINQFYQFFSDDAKNKIEQINYIKFTTEDDDFVFFTAQFKGENKIDLENIDLFRLSTDVLRVRPSIKFDPDKISTSLKFQPCNLFRIELGKAIKSYFKTIDFNSDIVAEDLYATIYNEIFDALHSAFAGRNIASSVMTEFVNLAVFTQTKIQEQLIYRQITTITSNIINEKFFTQKNIHFAEATDDAEKILDFLSGEF